MKRENKELLLKDLSARLPYKVVAQVTYKDSEGWKTGDRKVLGVYTDGQVYVDCVYTNIENVKPYLRPMSSMSEEEQVELGKLIGTASYNMLKGDMLHLDALLVHIYKNHIDVFGLIHQGLAIEAPEGMYNL